MLLIIIVLGCNPRFVPEHEVADKWRATVTVENMSVTQTITFSSKNIFEATSTKTPKPSAAPTVISTITQISLPDVLLNLIEYDAFICSSDESNQIWLSKYPYDTAQLLLADPDVDFNFPVWSPDGEWIAYVKSEPKAISDIKQEEESPGTDSIWIMRPDGSENRILSDPVPRIDYYWPDGCAVGELIIRSPTWSPDSKYIVFVHFNYNERLASYYLVEVPEGTTRLLLTQDVISRPVWISNHELAIVGGEISIINIEAIDRFAISSIPYPEEFPPDTRFGFSNDAKYSVQTRGRRLIGSLYKLEHLTPVYISLWELNVDSGIWTKLKDLSGENWGTPILGDQIAFSQGLDDRLYFLDPEGWHSIASGDMPETVWGLELFEIITSDMVSFVGIGEKTGIWIAALQDGNIEFDMLLDIEDYEISGLHAIYEYSWKP